MYRLFFPFGFLMFVMAVCGAAWTLLAQSDPGVRPVQIVDFRQSPEVLVLTLDREARNVKVLQLPRVPAQLDSEALRAKAKRMPGEHRTIVVPLVDEPTSGEYSIIIFAGNEWVELIRQSPTWLKATFDYNKADGHTILGRRTMVTPTETALPLQPLVFRGKPDLANLKPAGTSPFPEVRLAEGLLEELWREPVKQGPITGSYGEFLEEPFAEKLRRLRAGEFAVMCQGMRDMFVHGSEGVPGMRVRAVEAYNYRPQLNNLVTFGHSTAEIWVEQLGKWVLFDPWLAIMVVNRDGIPVGAGELNAVRDSNAASGFRVVPLVDRLHRTFRRGDGSALDVTFRPASVRISDFTVRRIGSSPGFVEYFRNVVYHEHKLQM